MNRRKILLYLGSAAVVPPLAAKAQPLPLPRVGFLNSASPDNYAFNAAAFRDGLREAHLRPMGPRATIYTAVTH